MNRVIRLFIAFFKIGLFTFGGGYAMIPLIEKEFVDRHHWIKREEILDLFAVSQSVPGAIAVNSSTLVGYKVAGVIGAVVATIGVVTPSVIIILVIAMFFGKIADIPAIIGTFDGINAAVILLIVMSGISMMRQSVHDGVTILLFVATLVAVVIFQISPILMIIGGAVIGLIMGGKEENV